MSIQRNCANLETGQQFCRNCQKMKKQDLANNNNRVKFEKI